MSQKAEPTNTSMDLLVLVQQKRNLDAAIALRTMHPGEALAVCAQLVLLALDEDVASEGEDTVPLLIETLEDTMHESVDSMVARSVMQS